MSNLSSARKNESGAPSQPPLGYLLRQAAAAHRLKMERALADLGITPPQFLIITLIATNPSCSNADLARLAQLATPTVTVILTNLAHRNAFHTVPHPVDKRIKLLKLSEAGETLLAECRKRAAVVEAELLKQLSAGETSVIGAWLRAVASGAGSG